MTVPFKSSRDIGPQAQTFSVVITRDRDDDNRYVRVCLRSHINGNTVPEGILVDTIRGLESNTEFEDWLRWKVLK